MTASLWATLAAMLARPDGQRRLDADAGREGLRGVVAGR
jgi:hypothetical protein